jgi:hypothetical protein
MSVFCLLVWFSLSFNQLVNPAGQHKAERREIREKLHTSFKRICIYIWPASAIIIRFSG